MFTTCLFILYFGLHVKGEFQIRLQGGTISSGRVEIRSSPLSEWGTICDDQWQCPDAHVACRQLGFDWGYAVVDTLYGSGTGPIYLDDVGCTGRENSLLDCTHSGWGVNNCGHHEDAGVSCFKINSETTYTHPNGLCLHCIV